MFERSCSVACVAVIASQLMGCDPCYPKTDADLSALVEREAAGCDFIYIEDSGLTSLEGLRGLRDVSAGVIVRRNAALIDVSALETIQNIPELDIVGNSALIEVRLQFAPDTQSIAINIQDSPTASISLEIGPEIGSLALESLSALTAIELERLSSLRVLRLENLAVLDDLTAFSDIEAVSNLHLRNLPLISTAEVDAFLAQLIEEPDVSSCGLSDGAACPEDGVTELEPDN